MKKLKFERKEIKKQQSSGITLIALVVTIIVLLILAGISIQMLTGDNGILKKAGEAKERTDNAQIKERIQLAELSAITDGKGTIDYLNLKNELIEEFGTEGTDWEISEETQNPWIITVGSVTYSVSHEDIPIDSNPGILEGSGTTEDPYVINSIEDLVALSYNVNSGTNLYEECLVTLGKNLNFEEDNSYANASAKYSKDSYGYAPDSSSEITIKEYMTNKSGSGFIPIGMGRSFKGNFNGNEKSLSNLYVNSNGFGGLFGLFSSNVTIKKLSIISCDIKGTNPSGAIVGCSSSNLQIERCRVDGNITTSSNAGGVIGSASNLTVFDSSYSGDITGSPVGGIVGVCGVLNLNNCCNKSGTIIPKSIGGGLVGTCSNISISFCYNKANISATNTTYAPIGGIAGSGAGTIDNCYNSGNVSLGNVAGGIIGEGNSNIDIINCYNNGIISSNNPSGGIVGKKPKSILNCYNFSSVSSTDNLAGGIVADGNGTINYSYNSGSITSSSSPVGGISGLNGTIKNCYNTGLINGTDGLTGYIIGSGSVENTNFYLKNISSIALSNGATEKTKAEMNEIMDIQSYCDLMNDYNEDTYGFSIEQWGIGNDGLPDFGLE